MLAGDFNIMNTMQAAVCAQMLGASVGDIRTAFALFSGVDGRLERIKLPKDVDFSVFIDYAHTPDALEKLLRTARGFADKCGRIVLLFGCGGDRERQKRATMGRIATALADMVIITGDNSRGERTADIINDILAGVERESCFIVIEDRRSAIEYAIKTAKGGDVVLLAGKGHEDYEVDSFGKKPFVEKEIVISAIEKYY
jgi:UDP-N-acetylmuramoyl-L-alanyl-D-glutamate--2,6-diaminopimelate ligase